MKDQFDEKTENEFNRIFNTEAIKYSRECGDRFRRNDKTIAGIKVVGDGPISKVLKESCIMAISTGQSIVHVDENLNVAVLDKSKIFKGE